MPIAFYACSQCKEVSDLDGNDLPYLQSKEHGFFWRIPATNCTGRLTVPSTKEEWEAQKNREYPHHIIEKYGL